MQEILNKVGERADAFVAYLREQSIAYPFVTAMIGGMMLAFFLSHLISPIVRLLWWRAVCWRNRMAGKLMHWSYDTDVADAVVAITNRYWLCGRLTDAQRRDKLRLLGNALSLPELHNSEGYVKLREYEKTKLRRKTERELAQLKAEPQHPDPGKSQPKVRLSLVKPAA